MQTIELHPEFLSKDGEKEYAVIPYAEFLALKDWLIDIEDLLDLDTAIEIEENAPSTPLEEVERKFGVTLAG
ncbi:MAG: hypothetical protein K1X52_01615 [Pyrinomonadaceae bacterium]|nr:hypothetical protein [Pyrinomonadaceae bacterium]